MSVLSVRLPNSVHEKLREVAQKEGISINQLISNAVLEKLSVLLTEDYIEERKNRASKAAFEAVLAQVPNVPPDEWDRLD